MPASVMTVEYLLGAAVAAGGTFTVPYASGFVQADFPASGTVNVSYSGVNTSCACTFGGSNITVTWPGGAPTSLPAGTYFLDFDASAGDPLGGDASKMATQADSTAADDITDSSGGTADGTINAISGSGADAGINKNFAEVHAGLTALQADLNALLAKAQAAGLMES